MWVMEALAGVDNVPCAGHGVGLHLRSSVLQYRQVDNLSHESSWTRPVTLESLFNGEVGNQILNDFRLKLHVF